MTATVDLPAFVVDPVAPERFSMSFLRSAEGCLRRAHHERLGDMTGPDAVVGRIFHEIAGAIGWTTVLRGHTTPDYVEAEQVAQRVLRAPEEHDPMSRATREAVLSLVSRWITSPSCEFHPEERFELDLRNDIDGRVVSARIDRLVIVDTTAWIKDYKTGRGQIPTGPTPQSDIYAWSAWQTFGVERVVFEQHHVLFGVASTPVVYEIDDLLAVDDFLRDQVARLESAYARGGELPATPGDVCGMYGGCPVADTCPAREWTRPATTLRSHEDALKELAALMAGEQTIKQRQDAIRGWLEREALAALVDGEAEALEQFAALMAEEATAAVRKRRLRGWVERAGVRAVQLDGQEIGYATDASMVTDWKRLAQSLGGDPSEFTTPKAPAFGRRRAKEPA